MLLLYTGPKMRRNLVVTAPFVLLSLLTLFVQRSSQATYLINKGTHGCATPLENGKVVLNSCDFSDDQSWLHLSSKTAGWSRYLNKETKTCLERKGDGVGHSKCDMKATTQDLQPLRSAITFKGEAASGNNTDTPPLTFCLEADTIGEPLFYSECNFGMSQGWSMNGERN